MNKKGYYTEEDMLSELTTKEREDRLNGIIYPLPSGWVDLNTIPLDNLVDKLYDKIKFRSDGDSYVIGKLINFYKINKSCTKN